MRCLLEPTAAAVVNGKHVLLDGHMHLRIMRRNTIRRWLQRASNNGYNIINQYNNSNVAASVGQPERGCICRHGRPKIDEMHDTQFGISKKCIRLFILFNPLCTQSIALFSLSTLFASWHVFAPNKQKCDDGSEIAFNRSANFFVTS